MERLGDIWKDIGLVPAETKGPPRFLQSLLCTLVAQKVKNLPAMWEIQVRSLGREDPLEKAMATHSSILAWRTPGTEEPGGLQSVGSQRVRHDRTTNTHFSLHPVSLSATISDHLSDLNPVFGPSTLQFVFSHPL